MSRRALRAALLLVALGVGDCSPPAEPAAPPRPDRGRTPADTMSYLGADWLTRPERIEEEQPEQMLAALHVRPGMVVADIGAGVGYHAFRLSVMVGPEGRVYATDLQPEMLAILRKSAAEHGVNNVFTILSGDTTTGLPRGAIDLALMVDVYHELGHPERFLDALKEALKPDGRLVLVEFRGEDPNVPIKEEHKMTAAQATRELDASGFSLIERQEILPWQHILIFAIKPH
jgi:ubiquinone/menaquinone biosynthesis C-methylase UbiE